MCVCARARGTVRPGAGRDSCVQNVWCRCSVCMCVFLNEGSISYFIRFMSRVSAGTHLRTLTYSRLSSLLFLARSIYLCDAYTIPRCLGPPLHTQRQRRTGDDDHPSGALILNSATVSYPYTVVTSRQDRNPRSHSPPLAHGAPTSVGHPHAARPRLQPQTDEAAARGARSPTCYNLALTNQTTSAHSKHVN